MPPYMSAEERRLLEWAAADRRTIVEYGVGGSTVIFARTGAERIVSIDADPAWIAKVGGNPDVAAGIAEGRVELVYADIGPTRAFSYPIDRASSALWPGYVLAPWSHVDPATVDFVFIDGRFRVAAALSTLLHCTADVTVLVHDFWVRDHYRAILADFVVVARVESMALLVPRRQSRRERSAIERTLLFAQSDFR